MNAKTLLLLGSVLLAACGNNAVEDAPVAATAAGTGEAAYLEHCAGCHETGMIGAPIVGDASYWAGRSRLWQAVLMEHAKTGYFDMPAKGGRPDLPDETIDAAVQYMMSVTFPDLPAVQ